MADPSSVLAARTDRRDSPPRLSPRARRAVRRLAEVVCPPGMRAHHRTDRVLDEFELMFGAMAPGARKGLTAAFVTLDQAARLYPRSRGRRFSRLDDEAAEAYIRALLARHGIAGLVARRVKGVLVMCYYELPPVQREIGYDPAPFIAEVSRRRQASYGPEIRAGEGAVIMRSEQIRAEQKVLEAEPEEPGGVLDADPTPPGEGP